MWGNTRTSFCWLKCFMKKVSVFCCCLLLVLLHQQHADFSFGIVSSNVPLGDFDCRFHSQAFWGLDIPFMLTKIWQCGRIVPLLSFSNTSRLLLRRSLVEVLCLQDPSCLALFFTDRCFLQIGQSTLRPPLHILW